MTNLYNFSVRKNNHYNYFIVSWQICPKNKKYVISKGLMVKEKIKLLKLLRHLRNSKNINFIKEYLVTWLDYGCAMD